MLPQTLTAHTLAAQHMCWTLPLARYKHAVLCAVTINLPSRYIPLMGLTIASFTIFGSVGLNRYYGHDIGGIPWPYISDTAKDAPQVDAERLRVLLQACACSWQGGYSKYMPVQMVQECIVRVSVLHTLFLTRKHI